MTTTTGTIQAPPPPNPAIAAAAQRSPAWRRPALIVGLVALAIALTYAYAWYNANRLSSQYISDADASYRSGKYLDALVGSESFDPARNEYVTKGGYLQVERIWQDSYAWPKPDGVDRASTRINEIINQRITIEEAEQFIQANTGKKNPYFGVIYLRLGELYEKEGDTTAAKEVYETVVDSFPEDGELVKKAKEHLAGLTKK